MHGSGKGPGVGFPEFLHLRRVEVLNRRLHGCQRARGTALAAARDASRRRAITGSGVPVGANNADHWKNTALTPDSFSVATSGSEARRLSPHEASTRTLPAMGVPGRTHETPVACRRGHDFGQRDARGCERLLGRVPECLHMRLVTRVQIGETSWIDGRRVKARRECRSCRRESAWLPPLQPCLSDALPLARQLGPGGRIGGRKCRGGERRHAREMKACCPPAAFIRTRTLRTARARGQPAGGRAVNGIVRDAKSQRSAVHIVIIAWLFIASTVALTLRSALAGAAFFVICGVAPVALYAWLALRRLEARRARSRLEQPVRDGDDADTQRDR